MLDLLKSSLAQAPVIKRGEYNYFIHPITDGIPRLDPDLMGEVCDAIVGVAELDVDYIMTVESMGIHLASVVSQKTGIPVNIVRKKQYWLPGEAVLNQSTGYGSGSLFMNYVEKGDVVTVIDSVISTGGTLIAVLKGLVGKGAIVKDVVCAIERGDGVERVLEETGFMVKTLVRVDVGKSVSVSSNF
ncbi:MAG: hypoxanthine/guanine phosphoribosyltransferase [Candidatus Altiarchaeota archaeon]